MSHGFYFLITRHTRIINFPYEIPAMDLRCCDKFNKIIYALKDNFSMYILCLEGTGLGIWYRTGFILRVFWFSPLSKGMNCDRSSMRKTAGSFFIL